MILVLEVFVRDKTTDNGIWLHNLFVRGQMT
jgi:hypothetical protein